MFNNGLKDGKGKWKKSSASNETTTRCNTYDGDYALDKKNGWGIFEWESGNKYQG